MLTAADLMKTGVEWIARGEPLQAAADRMQDTGLRCLLIRNEPDRLPGILTSKDIVNLVADDGLEILDSLIVGDLMASPAICIPKQAGIIDCVQTMRIAGVRRLPVLDGITVIGMLSSTDVFEAIVSSAKE